MSRARFSLSLHLTSEKKKRFEMEGEPKTAETAINLLFLKIRRIALVS